MRSMGDSMVGHNGDAPRLCSGKGGLGWLGVGVSRTARVIIP